MLRVSLLLLLALSCSRPSAEDRVAKAVLQQWERGDEHYQAARFSQAAQAFSQAALLRPDDVLLRSWHAAALASSGELDSAIGVLEDVVQGQGDVAQARYNLASYLARAGRTKEAATHLKRALHDGARLSWQAAGDEDFKPLLQDEAFSFLPDSSLVVTVEGPSGDLFVGAEFGVEMRVIGAGSEVVLLDQGVLPQGLELLSVVEDAWASVEGMVRQISWKLRVCDAGSYTLGSLRVKTSTAATQVQGPKLVALGDGHVAARVCGFERRLQTAEQVASHFTEEPLALRQGQDWWVKYTPQQVLAVRSPLQSPGAITYERRERGQTRWTVRQLRPAAGQALRATLREGDAVLWDSTSPQ